MRCSEPGCGAVLLYDGAQVEAQILHEVWVCSSNRARTTCPGGHREQRSVRGRDPTPIFDPRRRVQGEEVRAWLAALGGCAVPCERIVTAMDTALDRASA